jgi:hypothetical protein
MQSVFAYFLPPDLYIISPQTFAEASEVMQQAFTLDQIMKYEHGELLTS